LRKSYADATAIEMDGFGVLSAASDHPGVQSIVIRGISDLIERKTKDDFFQQKAAEHASAFTFELLAQLNVPDKDYRLRNVATGYQQESIILNKLLPEAFAVLHFHRNEQDYNIRMHHQNMPPFNSSELHLTLPIEFGQQQPWTLDTLGRLEGYQPKNCLLGQVLRWLRYLRSQQPVFSCLMIYESNPPIIPWELLNLTDNEPLGLALQIVRMSEISNDDDALNYEQLTGDSYCCQGQAVVYTTIAEETIRTTSRMGIQAYSYDVIVREEPLQILDHFRTVELDIGLVMITDSILQEITVELRSMYFKRTKILKRSPSLVMLRSDLESREHPVLARQFVQHGAKGVLGMLDCVKGDVVQQVVELFFEQYREDSDMPIPELLRRMRVSISQRLDNELTDEVIHLYIAIFTYAYYGSPNTILQLIPQLDR
jgi:hypothetical protein